MLTTYKYFIWYLILLPFYLPSSELIRKPSLGISAAALWVIAQVLRYPNSSIK